VAVKIKLKRLGKIRAPYYRIVVADSRTKRDGRAIEEIGKYHPKAEPSFIEVDSERAQHWLSVGAQPTDPVRKILEITGDWQKFKGLPGAEGTLRTAEPRPDRKAAFAAAAAETLADTEAKPKAKARPARARKAEGEKAEPEKPVADKPVAAKTVTDKPVADKPVAEKAAAKKPASGKAESETTEADQPAGNEATEAKAADSAAEAADSAAEEADGGS
jgi:small subunit ribosomal protein S16